MDDKLNQLGQKKVVDGDVKYILIGAGLPRTGTTSTKVALEQLLPGEVHHMVKAMACKTGRNVDFWQRAAKNLVTDDDWRQFIKDEKLSASIDYPSSLFWKDLVRLYPDAKVILTVRDPVKWYQSVKGSIYELNWYMHTPPWSWTLLPLAKAKGSTNAFIIPDVVCWKPDTEEFPKGMFGVVSRSQEESIRFFKKWNDEVRSSVPADKLLEFDVRQGWEPLCKFLGVETPDVLFPHANDTKDMKETISKFRRFCLTVWTGLTAVAGVAAYVYWS